MKIYIKLRETTPSVFLRQMYGNNYVIFRKKQTLTHF